MTALSALPRSSPASGRPIEERLLPGSQPAFREIFNEHAAFVWRTLRGLGIPESSIDDAVQEVFLIVLARLDDFEGRSSLRTWICAIAYRVGANTRRKLRRHSEIDLTVLSLPSSDPDPEQHSQTRASTRFVESFCARLSDGMRDVFVLCLLEERPASEVGELLGLSPHTVSSRIRLLRESFRRDLAERERINEAP